MQKWIHRVCVALALVGFLAPMDLASSGGEVLVAPVIDRMSKAFASIRSMRAEMAQQKGYAQLGTSDPTEHGILYVKKKNDRTIQIRVEITSPEQRIITVKDNRFLLFQPRINQAIEGSLDSKTGDARAAAGFFSYLLGGIAQASRDYNITVIGDEAVGNRPATRIRLTPRPEHRGLYREIDLWVDNEFWLPTQQRFVETNRDVTTVQLLGVKTNLPVGDDIFSQKLPSNTQRVRG